MKSSAAQDAVREFMQEVEEDNPGQDEFHQAVEEVVQSIMPWYLDHDDYRRHRVLERLVEPDRVISFRVAWQDDDTEVHVNRAWRVQFSNSIGPYKGGLRFHPTVDESVLKFLAFEQIFKNSLTGLPMGGGKGGSNFDPKGRSDAEIMRFCQAMMSELYRYIGEDVDIPAGDIGVGPREISYLFGHYLRIANRWAGAMTGKKLSYGGSRLRTEATGYGCVYFCQRMLQHAGREFSGSRIAISGSGNVALYAAEKAIEEDAIVVSLSDSDGTLHFPDGLEPEGLAFIMDLKENRDGRIEEAQDEIEGSEYHDGDAPWRLDCDIAMPCATQNELNLDDAETLVESGVVAVCEGANMPVTPEASLRFRDSEVLHAPGKASNAGGVAVSGLEQSQNALRQQWSRDEVDDRLQTIMCEIHEQCVECGTREGKLDYVDGANLSGFRRVAEAVFAQGL